MQLLGILHANCVHNDHLDVKPGTGYTLQTCTVCTSISCTAGSQIAQITESAGTFPSEISGLVI